MDWEDWLGKLVERLIEDLKVREEEYSDYLREQKESVSKLK